MKSREAELRDLVRDWLRKADMDCDVAARLVSDGDRFRDIVAFHCQQAVEKYLKSILVRHQVEFRKTHDIERLLDILRGVEPSIAEGLAGAKWLTPFGVDIRYPGDFPETLPGDETRALGLAQGAREAAIALLSPFLAEFDSARVDTEAEGPKRPEAISHLIGSRFAYFDLRATSAIPIGDPGGQGGLLFGRQFHNGVLNLAALGAHFRDSSATNRGAGI